MILLYEKKNMNRNADERNLSGYAYPSARDSSLVYQDILD